MPELARNGDGDMILFFHKGEGSFYCDYGHMTYREGDYINIPRGTSWRLETKVRNEVLTIEATAVLPEGRISYGDVGLWSDETEAALRHFSGALLHGLIARGHTLASSGAGPDWMEAVRAVIPPATSAAAPPVAPEQGPE